MRARVLLCLCCLCGLLTACAAPGPTVGARPPAPPGTPATPAARSAATPAPALAASALLERRDTSQAQRRYEIRPVDPATGQAAPGYGPVVAGENTMFVSPYAFSADGRALAVAASRGQSCTASGGGTACRASADVLRLVALPTWREVDTPLPGDGWAWPLAFSPDAARLALVYHAADATTLLLFDAATGAPLAHRALDFSSTLLWYTRDGAALALYGQPPGADPGMSRPGTPRVLLLDAASLATRWEQPLANILSGAWCQEACDAAHGEQLFASWTPAAVPAPDGSRLYIIHADDATLTTVDLAARAVRTAEIRPAQSWFERLLAGTASVAAAKGGERGAYKAAVISPDGTRLYVIGRAMRAELATPGDWQTSDDALGLQVVDAASGRLLASHPGDATALALTPDGARVLLSGRDDSAPWTEVLDAGSLQPVARVAGWWQVAAGRRLDGQPVVLASQPQPDGQATRLALLDPRSFAVVHTWTVDGYATWLTGP
ncbi:MAG TPA: hypothetical protein VFW96_23455 [Thermomicrobiales bacterium]|nr:hypothetical protein [Thermomicrobiales bacterium]